MTRRLFATCVAATLVTAACGGGNDSAEPPVTTVTVSSVSISGVKTMDAGKTTQLSASAVGSDGYTMNGRTYAWTSSDNAVATVDGNGLVSGVAAGSARITASTGGKSASVTVTVNQPVPAGVGSIALIPANGVSFVAGATLQIIATATNTEGHVMTGQTFTWTTSDERVATVSSTGLVTGVGGGSATITAAAGDKSASLVVTITTPATNPTVATVTIGSSATVEVGKTVQFTATAKAVDGTVITGRTVAWTSSNPSVLTVTPTTGLVTGVAAGTATLSAAVDGVSASITITCVNVASTGLTITGSFNLQVGTTTQLTATLRDGSGNVIAGAPITWFTSDSTMVSVSPTGVITALRIGTATIAAVSGTASSSAQITSSLSPYTFVFAPGMTAADQQMIKDNVQFAHAFQKNALGRQIQNPTNIVASTNAPGCAQGGAAAFQSQGALTFCVSNPGWLNPPPKLRQKIVQHELFHVWQFENHWIGNPATSGATWLIEGAAELMGYRGIADRGLITIPVAIGCQVKESTDFKVQHPPGLPALSTVETLQSFNTTVGPLYTVSMLAADQLTQTNGLTSLRVYADLIAGGTAWPTAFQTAFGMSTTDFYAQFPAYLASLPVPATYQCGQ